MVSRGGGGAGGGGYGGRVGAELGGAHAAPAMMAGLLGSALTAFERIAALSTATCGGCQKELQCHRQRPPHDPALSHVFAVRPVGDAGAEVARATQRGAWLAREGRAEDAVRELHDARQLAPRSAEACCNVACAYYLSGDDSTALYWYGEARRLNPRGEVAAQAQAFLEQRRGRADEARRLLVAFLREVDASNVAVLRQLGKLHMREEQWSKAAGCFHKLIAVEPANSEWPAQLQVCLNNLHVKDEHGEPVHHPSGGPGGGVLALAVSFAEPLMRAVAASELADGRPARPSTGSGGPRPQQLQEARALLEAGRSQQAVSAFEAMLRREPRSYEALLGLADAHAQAGDFDAALEAGKQLLGVRPDEQEANLRVAELLLAAGYGAEMVGPYLKWAGGTASGSREFRIRALCAAADTALLQEDFPKAHASASEAVRVDAESPRALMLLGGARLRVAEYAAALRALGAAAKVARAMGRGGEARLLRGRVHALTAEAHERQRQYPQALTEAQKALDEWPQLSAARVVRATALQQSGRVREAEEELERLLQGDPRNPAARLQLGYCQLCAGRARAAEESLERVVRNGRATRSALGAAKVYLAIAVDLQAPGAGGGSQHRAESIVKEGLSAHRNLQQVWKDIDGGGAASGQSAEVQRLRGICDLDLTAAQAKQLLRLLARATGRTDLASTPAASTCGSRAYSDAPPTPNRWAPPMGGLGLGGGWSRSGASTPFAAPGAASPVPSQRGPGPLGPRRGYCGTSGQGTPQQGFRGRSPSPSPVLSGVQERGASRLGHQEEGAGDPLTIGWNELIRPEQLVYGPQLGAGGSASVFRGSWNGQEVAIKKISGIAHLDSMRKEINALRRLRHARLVRFIGACVQPPQLLVVTEFMPGGSLHDRLFGARRDPPLAMLQRWLIGCQTAEGLAFLHAQRVVHRDLKSMNILLDAQQAAKICDFGLAQQMPEMATHIQRKLDGEEGGSPRYMAPECYDAANGKLTEKVDIWAMGCILIELFGGVLPYGDCQSMAQLVARILVQRRPPDIPAIVPPSIAPTIQRCLSFDPTRRFAAPELQQALAAQRLG